MRELNNNNNKNHSTIMFIIGSNKTFTDKLIIVPPETNHCYLNTHLFVRNQVYLENSPNTVQIQFKKSEKHVSQEFSFAELTTT